MTENKNAKEIVPDIIYARWYRSNNFGDALNPWLIEKITGIYPQNIQYSKARKMLNWFAGIEDYIVVGSILEYARKDSIVWGAGLMYRDSVLRFKPKRIMAVRGPLTQERLSEIGISCPKIYGDPALLLSRYYNPDISKTHQLGIIPHYVDKNHAFLTGLGKQPGIKIIDIEKPTEQVIRDIMCCERIASSALHGIICADSYGIPSVWIKLSDKVAGEGFKFEDYFLSVGRKETLPLIIAKGITLEDVNNHFSDYSVKIDLDELMRACPFKTA